jgi:hypothetical protein
MMQAAVGAIGGMIGSSIWKPLPKLTAPLVVRDLKPKVHLAPPPSSFEGPIAWGRVLAGMAIGVGGVVWANVILEFVLEASEGKLSLDSHVETQLVTWEICALALLFGSALAGSGTTNGAKQGLCVGIGASAILLGLGLASGTLSLNLLVFTVMSSVSLGLVGGWFGGQLLPPVERKRRRLFNAAAL